MARTRNLLLAGAAIAAAVLILRWLLPGTGAEKAEPGLVEVAAPLPPAPAPAPAAPPPPKAMLAQARPQLALAAGHRQIVDLPEPGFEDPRKSVLCGEVLLAERGGPTERKRYVSFPAAQITVIDDGTAGFAEIYLSSCNGLSPAAPHRPARAP